MKKGISYLAAGMLLSSIHAYAYFRPVAGLSLGADFANISMDQNITILAPYQNTYVGHPKDTQFAGSFFMGFETPLYKALFAQLGVSYYINNPFKVQGNVYQFTDPTFNNLSYQYKVQSQRFFVEGKLLTVYKQFFHPYLTGGVGTAANKAYGYSESPDLSSILPMPQPFGHHTTHCFAYQLGVGLDMDISKHSRLGGGYKYLSLGQAQLSTTPLQQSSDVLQNNNLHINELFLQLSYLG